MFYLPLILLCVSCSKAEEGPIVETSLGKIQGFYKESFDGRLFSAFEGIPYAKPPVGDLRFEEPQPVLPWKDVLVANSIYTCKQVEYPFQKVSSDSEDCLYLNVYVPKRQPSKNDNYDVIVNTHGGAFMVGSSAIAGPNRLMDRDIIYVNLNYRLGVLGFLSTEDDIVPGNNGLKDQQMALKWVQSHIKDFGGNPKSVTLMGLSAGGASVHFHYFSPQSRGLFHRGISQSGTALMPWAMQEKALEKTMKLAKSLNCENDDTQELINCLKSVSADDLMEETKSFYDVMRFPLAPFAPVVEVKSQSAFLTKHPYNQLKGGDMYDVPWMTWIAKDEGILGVLFLSNILGEVDNKWNEWSEHLFDYKYVCSAAKKKEVAKKIKTFYFNDDRISEGNKKQLIKVFGDRLFNVGFENAVEMQAKMSNSPVYAAIYSYNKSTAMMKMLGAEVEGVSHGAEGILLHDMGSLAEGFKLSESDVLMKNVLIDFVTSFASHGKPKSNNIEWPSFSETDPKYLVINDFNDATMAKIDDLSSREFWNSLSFTEDDQYKFIREEL